MREAEKKADPRKKKEAQPHLRVVVEVDGHPVGFLNLDIDRLWPLINHRKRDIVPVEWMDPAKFETLIRAAVVKRLMSRLETDLYHALGDQIVRAELDVESFTLKAESAAQAFGRRKTDIEQLVADTDCTPLDFYGFFWEYLLDDREVVDLKKEWKTVADRL